MSLSADRSEVLANFQAITQADEDTSWALLETRGWNLERAVQAFYEPASEGQISRNDYEDGAEFEDPATSERRPMMDSFGIDDSDAAGSSSSSARRAVHARRPSGAGGAGPVGGALWWLRQAQSVLAIPLGLLWSAATVVLGLLARLLHIRPASGGSLRPRNPFSTPASHISRLDPRSAAERFVRSLEETTGAVRWSRRHEPAAGGVGSSPSASTSAASTVEVGSSTAEGLRRRPAGAAEQRALPDFFIGSYDDALRKAKHEARVLMIVLTCEEHEAAEHFARGTLTDPDLLALLQAERIIVWGGDTRAKDAYQVSKIVQCYRLPFVGFVSLLPPNATSTGRGAAANAQPGMALLSRLESLDSVSPAALCTHISGTVLPRVSVFLNRQRAAIASREAERRLRQEQDAAVERAAKADLDRVLKKRAEVERERKEREQRDRDATDLARRQQAAMQLRVNAFRWRAQQRESLSAEGPKDGVRVRVRLGDGRRVLRSFARGDSLERVYAWIECELETDADRARAQQEASQVASAANYKHRFGFGLATTMPRQEVDQQGTVGGWSGSNGGLEGEQLVVEGLEERRRSMGEGEEGDSEEYESEDEMN